MPSQNKKVRRVPTNTMAPRKVHRPGFVLRYTALAFMFGGVLAIGNVLSSSLWPSAKARAVASANTVIVNLNDLKVGEAKAFIVGNVPLFVLKPSPRQTTDLRALDAHVWDSNLASYNEEHDFYIYWAISTRLGCALMHRPVTEEDPYSNNRNWLGGLYDPCHDSSYDYAGRALKSYKYTFNGFYADVPNLHVPTYAVDKAGRLSVGMLKS